MTSEISLPFPNLQSEVVEVLKRLRQREREADARLELIRQHIRSVQWFCDHPETNTYRDYSGESNTVCKICGMYL